MILLANGKVITRDPDGAGYLPDGGVVTDGGKIVEQGTHDQLVEKGGVYEKLYQSQFADDIDIDVDIN